MPLLSDDRGQHSVKMGQKGAAECDFKGNVNHRLRGVTRTHQVWLSCCSRAYFYCWHYSFR